MNRLSKWFELLYSEGRTRRDGQVAMAEQVLSSLQTEGICVCEGGTGIGKSFAVLLAAMADRERQLEQAEDDDELPPIIYSTGTIALQSQIVDHDLPSLLKLIGSDFTFALAKGRGRYACTKKLIEAVEARRQSSVLDQEQDQADAALYRSMDEQLKAKRWNGDLDQFDGAAISSDHKATITIEGASCTKRRCPHFSHCPFFRARNIMRTRDIVVVNHSLLLSDLSLGGGVILPADPKQSVFLIDEAHRIPQTAVSHFGSKFSVSGSGELFTSFTLSLNRLLQLTGKKGDLRDLLMEASDAAKASAEALEEISQSLTNNSQLFDEGEFLFKSVPDFLAESLKRLQKQAISMQRKLDRVIEIAKQDEDLDSRLISDSGFYLAKANNVSETITRLFDDAADPPIAKWIDDQELLHAYPVSASQLLYNAFWKEVRAAALFSATIRAVGQFDKFLSATGLNLLAAPPATNLFTSSFDYGKSRLLAINDGPEPNDDAHPEMVASVIHGAIEKADGGILVIFTSRKLMGNVREIIIGKHKAMRKMILSQGDYPTGRLIARHKKNIGKGKVSVLFGLASFGEGLDLPGKLCEMVIIPRIPFAVPTTPLERARVDWIQSTGGKPFFDLALPDASIKFTQMVGRLIRSETDQGHIIILDNRIINKRYGSQLLQNLPPFKCGQFSVGEKFS